jgi:hypothetical protein
MLKRSLAGPIVALVMANGAAAGPFEDGFAAVGRGDYAAARQLWTPLAEQGSVAAQLNLGLMYEFGHGVQKDPIEATKWYRRAEQGMATPNRSSDGAVPLTGAGTPPGPLNGETTRQEVSPKLPLLQPTTRKSSASRSVKHGSRVFQRHPHHHPQRWKRRKHHLPVPPLRSLLEHLGSIFQHGWHNRR